MGKEDDKDETPQNAPMQCLVDRPNGVVLDDFVTLESHTSFVINHQLEGKNNESHACHWGFHLPNK